MRSWLATFQVDDPAKVDGEIATTRRYLEVERCDVPVRL